MRILNISSIIPLEGLKRENDIVLRVQDYLSTQYGYKFIVVKSLPLTPRLLGFFNQKWKTYNNLIRQGKVDSLGQSIFIYPWILPPTSNWWINYFFLPHNLLLFKFFLKKKLLRLAKNADILVAQNTIPDSIIAYLIFKHTQKPYILNIRGAFNPAIMKFPFMRKVYRNAQQLITHSPRNFQQIKPYSKIELIPHAIDSLYYYDNPKDVIKNLEFISVCRLLPVKNLDWVLIALAKIKKKQIKFLYHIIGDGPEMEKLQELSKELGISDNVVFHGYLSPVEIKAKLIESHVFVMPSFPETLGRAFLEAAASKCLIVGHKNTGVDGLLLHKISGIFVDQYSLASELDLITGNYNSQVYDEIILNATDIIKDLTWKEIGKKYSKVYSSCLSVDNVED